MRPVPRAAKPRVAAACDAPRDLRRLPVFAIYCASASGLAAAPDPAVMAPAVHDSGIAVFASSRSAAIRFCSVRRLIPNISAARLRLPPT